MLLDPLKRFLTVMCVVGCSGGGGGAPSDATPGDGPGHDGPGGNNIDGGFAAPINDRCASATTINLATMHSDLTATTLGAHADLAAPCGTIGTADVFFTFTLSRRELVYADTFGASSGTTLFFASSCTTALTASTTTGDRLCSAGACGTSQAQVMALLDPGTYYLVLAGQSAATIHFQHGEVGSGSVTYLPQGMSTQSASTSGFGMLFACEAGGAENAYWWQTCPADVGGTLHASTCTGTDFDTILSLQLPGSESTLCNDDSCGFQSSLTTNIPGGAGLFILAIDGFSQAKHGNYVLTSSRP